MHGINYGCKCEHCSKGRLPPVIKQRFAERIKPKGHNLLRTQWFFLKGVAQTLEEMLWMESVTKNGHREVHIVIRHTAGGDWYGIYVRGGVHT